MGRHLFLPVTCPGPPGSLGAKVPRNTDVAPPEPGSPSLNPAAPTVGRWTRARCALRDNATPPPSAQRRVPPTRADPSAPETRWPVPGPALRGAPTGRGSGLPPALPAQVPDAPIRLGGPRGSRAAGSPAPRHLGPTRAHRAGRTHSRSRAACQGHPPHVPALKPNRGRPPGALPGHAPAGRGPHSGYGRRGGGAGPRGEEGPSHRYKAEPAPRSEGPRRPLHRRRPLGCPSSSANPGHPRRQPPAPPSLLCTQDAPGHPEPWTRPPPRLSSLCWVTRRPAASVPPPPTSAAPERPVSLGDAPPGLEATEPAVAHTPRASPAPLSPTGPELVPSCAPRLPVPTKPLLTSPAVHTTTPRPSATVARLS